jgi:hypothetical protein
VQAQVERLLSQLRAFAVQVDNLLHTVKGLSQERLATLRYSIGVSVPTVRTHRSSVINNYRYYTKKSKKIQHILSRNRHFETMNPIPNILKMYPDPH